MQPPKVPLNYFYSSEFYNTVQVIGTMSIPYIVVISKTGLGWDTGLALLFSGIVGGMAKARKDLELSPNLYTPDQVAGTNKSEAIAYVAKNIALEQATKQVISNAASDRIEEVASNIIAETPIPELLKPYVKKSSRDFLGRFFR